LEAKMELKLPFHRAVITWQITGDILKAVKVKLKQPGIFITLGVMRRGNIKYPSLAISLDP